MNEKVDQVAEAMFGPLPSKFPTDGACLDLIAFRRSRAREVIEAMRVPTLAMTMASEDAEVIGDGGGIERGSFDREWRAAIDAALK